MRPYRGLWGALILVINLHCCASLARKEELPETLQGLTINWNSSMEAIPRIRDWRLHLTALTLATIGLYDWLW
jgi:hypothetical protein